MRKCAPLCCSVTRPSHSKGDEKEAGRKEGAFYGVLPIFLSIFLQNSDVSWVSIPAAIPATFYAIVQDLVD